jgi:hypothetical protein
MFVLGTLLYLVDFSFGLPPGGGGGGGGGGGARF